MDRVIGLFGGPERDDYDGLWSRCDGHELDDGGGIIYCGRPRIKLIVNKSLRNWLELVYWSEQSECPGKWTITMSSYSVELPPISRRPPDNTSHHFTTTNRRVQLN